MGEKKVKPCKFFFFAVIFGHMESHQFTRCTALQLSALVPASDF